MGPELIPVLDAAATLLLGAVCAACGTPARGLCPPCRSELADPRTRRVAARGPEPVWAASSYAGAWRDAVVAYKERRAWHLAAPLGRALALAVAEALREAGSGGPVALVPMPSRPSAVRERGLDVTAALARRAASELTGAGLPTRVDRCLTLTRGVVDQGGLGESDRWQNRVGSLVARTHSGPVTRVVVDDITTTGASLGAAFGALAGAGTPSVAAAVVAATPRRDGRS